MATQINSSINLTNNSNLAFSSIRDEKFRTYDFPNGTSITITDPLYLNVSKSGGHRVLDAGGISHYIPSGWNHLYWVVDEGAPAFAF